MPVLCLMFRHADSHELTRQLEISSTHWNLALGSLFFPLQKIKERDVLLLIHSYTHSHSFCGFALMSKHVHVGSSFIDSNLFSLLIEVTRRECADDWSPFLSQQVSNCPLFQRVLIRTADQDMGKNEKCLKSFYPVSVLVSLISLVKVTNTLNLLEKQCMHACLTQQFLADYNAYLNTLSDVKGLFKLHPLS